MINRPVTHWPAFSSEIFTSFGTVIYYDRQTGTLRHSNPRFVDSNVRLTQLQSEDRVVGIKFLICNDEDHLRPLIWEGGGFSLADIESPTDSGIITQLEVFALERGLIALRYERGFFRAEPDGGITAQVGCCGLPAAFLTSDNWFYKALANQPVLLTESQRREIAKFIIDARVRAIVCRDSQAKKILIYGYPYWSHGRVYYDLSVWLHKLGYIVDIIDWQQSHDDYMDQLSNFYDVFLTSPDGVNNLIDHHRIPVARVILILHAEMDTKALVEQKGVHVFDSFAGYGVVSDFLFSASMIQGIQREPEVVGLGINYDEFFADIPQSLTTVGYASSMSVNVYGVEIKRGHLAEIATEQAGLAFVIAGATARQQSFVDMPDFYRQVDAVVTSSLTEAAQLPVMEAAAAGRLVISTPVGHFTQKLNAGVGILAPIHPQQFVSFVVDVLRHYSDHPSEFQLKCRRNQEAARSFDWSNLIPFWVKFIDKSFEESAARLIALAHEAFRSGHTPAAVAHIRKAARLTPIKPELVADHARFLLNSGDHSQALALALCGLSSALRRSRFEDHAPDEAEANLLDILEIAANHHKGSIWIHGKTLCEWLAIERNIPGWVRNNARRNLRWYAQEAQISFPSLQQRSLEFPGVDGFLAGNLSICRYSDGYAVAVRFSNSKLADDHFGYVLAQGEVSISKIFLCILSSNLDVIDWHEVVEPSDLPRAEHSKYLGFEDPRIFSIGAEIFCSCTVCQLNPHSIGQMVLARIFQSSSGDLQFSDWKVVSSQDNISWEKNWMPFVLDGNLRFIYSIDPTRTLYHDGSLLSVSDPGVSVETFKGGSQAVEFDGGWLTLVHEWEYFDGKRYYFHRFVWLDSALRAVKTCERFYFVKSSVEFAAGLCWSVLADNLLVTFSLEDNKPFLIEIAASDIRKALYFFSDARASGWSAVSSLDQLTSSI